MRAKFQSVMEQVILVVSIAGPLTTAPQAIKIWAGKSTEGVSLFTWTAYFSISICWLLYGISKKDKPLMIANALLIILQGLVVLGTLVYG
ncbi:MAG: hypothetical protein HZB68_05430 [Candidatus Aenigmarchaeota archaeon]|nr:hypothetical protein [Candidatus Aenigmarchaeota archaeon]